MSSLYYCRQSSPWWHLRIMLYTYLHVGAYTSSTCKAWCVNASWSKYGEAKSSKIGKNRKLKTGEIYTFCWNRGGEFINFLEIVGTCKMHHWLKVDGYLCLPGRLATACELRRRCLVYADAAASTVSTREWWSMSAAVRCDFLSSVVIPRLQRSIDEGLWA